jgi:tetratricopeptide (TPR) repeat protein
MKTMKKTVFTFLAAALTSSFAFSQTVDDGIKFLYYGKNKSAEQALEKVVAGKPKDAYSIYWLGQAYLAEYRTTKNKDAFAKAKSIYQQALQAGVNEAWIWVGSAHVLLLENGDINAAKQSFEQAITSTKGKKGIENADILNAIGRANADGSSTQGDLQYAIDKLKRAAEIDTKNPDIDINLGVCYLKQGGEHGGDAVQAFTDATVRDPKYAAGYYKIGRIYQSQDNKESMDENYGKAIAADPAYAPVYYSYYVYYAERDVNAAKEFIDKYIANSDQDCETNYFQADYLFRAGKYQESLDKAKAMEAGECKTFDRLNVLYAYNYDRLGDSLQAKSYLGKYFAEPSVSPTPDYYVFAGKLYAKFPGSEDSASFFLKKAIALDTIKKNKLDFANTAINIMVKAGKIRQQIEWLNIKAGIRGDNKLTEAEFYKLGTSVVAAIDVTKDSVTISQQYALADSVSKAYIATYPDKPQGYTLRVSAAKKADKDSSQGLALEPIKTANQFYYKDSAASYAIPSIKSNFYYLVSYYLNKVKGMPKIEQYRNAAAIFDEIIAVSVPGSEENKIATDNRDKLRGAVTKYDAAHGGAKPAAKP